MNIVVLVKQVPDTATRIKVAPSGTEIDRQGVNFVVNPYDEFAIEEAIRIKEKLGGQVTVLTVGEQKTEEALRTALAMGADEAVRVSAEVQDPLTTARAIAFAVRELAPDLVLAGKQAVDDDEGQVGSLVAALLDWPQVTVVTKLELTAEGGVAEREIEGGVEVVEFTLPAVVTAQKGLNEPRYASLPGIMKAKRKEIRQIAADQSVTLDPMVRTTALELPPARTAGKILTGMDAQAAAKELVRLLHEEAKLI
ncbi:MAG: electron transfer flavoprotein subunit beta/FixA family protein [Thermaerobacter sp.]|nr:electron transfer flavoprotein subunit beta/FixA family protein [Thermaerobacter sp.]